MAAQRRCSSSLLEPHHSRCARLAPRLGSRLAFGATVCHHARRSGGVRSESVERRVHHRRGADGRSRRTAELAAVISARRPSRRPWPMPASSRARSARLYVGNMMSGILAQQQQLGGLDRRLHRPHGHRSGDDRSRVCFGWRRGPHRLPGRRRRHSRRRRRLRRRAHDPRRSRCRHPRARDGRRLGARRRLRRVVLVAEREADARVHGTSTASRAERFAPFAITAHQNALTNPNALLHKAARPRNVLRVAHRHGPDPIVRRLPDLQRRERGHPRRTARGREHLPSRRPRVRIAGSALATAPLALARRPDPLDLTAVKLDTSQR